MAQGRAEYDRLIKQTYKPDVIWRRVFIVIKKLDKASCLWQNILATQLNIILKNKDAKLCKKCILTFHMLVFLKSCVAAWE